tara:strand:+ start:385 stop:798 length:414 start_codon:yes stop_codon:yes gene_type:complete
MTVLEEKLDNRNIRPTAMRLLVLNYFMQHDKAIPLRELEDQLDTADKSTLYRTLKTFEGNGLVHSIDDGSGTTKYALCMEGCTCSAKDQNYHFHCTSCGETFCLTSRNLPVIDLPKNFKLQQANLVLKGICSHCNES